MTASFEWVSASEVDPSLPPLSRHEADQKNWMSLSVAPLSSNAFSPGPVKMKRHAKARAHVGKVHIPDDPLP